MKIQNNTSIFNISIKTVIMALGFISYVSNAEVLTQEQAAAIVKEVGTKSGCLACHAVDGARVGPSYKDIAAKYSNPDASVKKYLEGKSAADYLMGKVREGTKIGKNKHWEKDAKTGRAFGMMTPNPKGRISDENLKKMIDAILALK